MLGCFHLFIFYTVSVCRASSFVWVIINGDGECGDGGGGHWLVRMEWRPAGWSVCLPLLIFPCTIKSRSSLLASAHRMVPEKGRKTVVVMVNVDDSCVQAYLQPNWVGLVWGSVDTWCWIAFIKWTGWTLGYSDGDSTHHRHWLWYYYYRYFKKFLSLFYRYHFLSVIISVIIITGPKFGVCSPFLLVFCCFNLL